MLYRCCDTYNYSQEPALWALEGTVVVTRFGGILANGRNIILDPGQHGVCHRMRPPEDLTPRKFSRSGTDAGPEALLNESSVREVFVISQPWGHTVFHFIAECLPKVFVPCVAMLHLNCAELRQRRHSTLCDFDIFCHTTRAVYEMCRHRSLALLSSEIGLCIPISVIDCDSVARARTGCRHPGARTPVD